MIDFIILPPGDYFIGDPCYVIVDDEHWDKVSDLTLEHDNDKFSYTINDQVGYIYSAGTAYGDGTYRGTDNFDYSVDSGCIGLVDLKLIDPEIIPTVHENTLGRIVSAPGGMTAICKAGLYSFSIYDADKTTRLEKIMIDTEF